MTHAAYISAFLVLCAMCLLWCGCGRTAAEIGTDSIQGVPIAHVNGEPIMSETFRDEYVGYLLKTGLQDKPGYRQHVLNTQIAGMLLVQEAEKNGIESTSAFQEASVRIRKKLLVDIYVRKALFDTIQVAEDELKDMFVRANTTLKARHLYAADAARATELYERLMSGETFESLAKEVFADTALANNGGYIGEFTVDDMDRAFEEAAFSLEVGEISQPVRTTQGYSIIRVEDRFLKPLITEYEYAERRDRMYQFVSYRKKSAARASHVRSLLGEVSPAYNQPVLERLHGFVAGELSVEDGESIESWFDEILVSFSSAAGPASWSVADFQEVASETSDEQRMRVRTREDLKDFINGLIAREEMAIRSEVLGFDQDPVFRYELGKALDNWIWNSATQTMLSEAQLPEDSLYSYYQAHIDDFTPAPTIEVSEILLRSKEKAIALMNEVDAESFAALASTHSIRPGADANGGYMGYVRQTQLGVLWNHVSKARAGDILGPIEVDEHYVILKVGERQEADLGAGMNKAEILKHFREKNGKKLIQDHVEALMENSSVAIDESLLASLPLKQSEAVSVPLLN